MENKKDWKKIEEDEQKRKSNIIGKYGFDIEEYTEEKLKKESIEKRKKRSKTIKIAVVLFIVLCIFIQLNSVSMKSKLKIEENLIEDIKSAYNEDVEIISDQTYWRGKGFYTLRLKDIPEIEYNAVVTDNNFYEGYSSDFVSRYYKYYFENWKDENKYKFVPNEVYEDNVYKFFKRENERLTFYTYIEVNSYEEMLEATEDIIRFIEYMGNNSITVGSYIKVGDELIIPSGKNNEEIRKSAKWQYEEIIKRLK